MQSLLDPTSAAYWSVVSCQGINDDGVIAAQAFHGAAGGGRFAAVLLVPVPEPSTVACLAGLAGWVLSRRRPKS